MQKAALLKAAPCSLASDDDVIYHFDLEDEAAIGNTTSAPVVRPTWNYLSERASFSTALRKSAISNGLKMKVSTPNSR